ncbi:SIMPL domain-containing protein [Bacillus piscicola]|uniref:SIMPL domain-containing protein n=1 Tax=Bacillus piscicola TaxID=1632684 RepID=UPI001F08C02C|nr:SIMPL domain-containing protein [Bacillus piscicola]
MERKSIYAISVIATGLVVAAFAYIFLSNQSSPEAIQASAPAAVQSGTLLVGGEGKLDVPPDLAIIRLGAEAQDQSAEKAQQAVSKKMKGVQKLLHDYGIKEENIKTVRIGVHPYQSNQEDKEKFRAQHILEIQFEDMEKVGELLDDAAAAGANRIEQVSFTLRDASTAEEQALQQAIKSTKSKAAAMAKSAGRSVGEIIQISERGTQAGIPMQSYQREELATQDSSNGTSVSPGEIKIRQQVDVVYELK